MQRDKGAALRRGAGGAVLGKGVGNKEIHEISSNSRKNNSQD